MDNLKKKILILCGKCGNMKIVPRQQNDLKDSIFILNDCPDCAEDFTDKDYYGKNGLIPYTEKNSN